MNDIHIIRIMISLIVFGNTMSTDAVVISSSSKVTFAYVLFYYAIYVAEFSLT